MKHSKRIVLTPAGGELYMSQMYVDDIAVGTPMFKPLSSHLIVVGNYNENCMDKIKSITIEIERGESNEH